MQTSNLAIGKFTIKHKPNLNNQLDYEILSRLTEENQDQNYLSSVIGPIDQNEDVETYNISQNLNYYYTLDDKNIFALEAQHVIKNEDPFYNAMLENNSNYQPTAFGLGLDSSESSFNLAQERKIKSNQLDAKLDYWNILNIKSDLNFTLGAIYSNQKFDSEIFQFLETGAFYPTPLINGGLDYNDVDYTFTDMYLGVHYRLKSGKFTISPGFTAHAYNSKNTQHDVLELDVLSDIEYDNSFFKLLPDFNVIFQIKNSENLRLNYAMRTQFTDVTKLARGLVLNNYNSIFSGDQELQNALSHNINLTYYSFNLFNYTNVFARLSYNKSIDQIRNLTSFESVIATSSPFNSSFADETLSASGRYQRSFGKIRGTLNAGYNYSKFNQFIQSANNPSLSENFSQNYKGSIRTLFKSAPNIEVGYSYIFSDNNIGDISTQYYTKSPYFDIDALILKSFTFRTNYSQTRFSNQDELINSYKFWDASLSYRKSEDSKWEFEVKATNLLDTKSQSNSSTSNISISSSEYFIQPRFITFRFIYSL